MAWGECGYSEPLTSWNSSFSAVSLRMLSEYPIFSVTASACECTRIKQIMRLADGSLFSSCAHSHMSRGWILTGESPCSEKKFPVWSSCWRKSSFFQEQTALPSHVPPVVSVGPSSQPLWAGRKKHPWYCESSQEPARKPILFYLWYQLLTKQQRYHHHRCKNHKKQCGQQRWALSRHWWRNQRSRKRRTR